jgi:ABC-type polysaccharide/polyol phosphate export permease
MSKTDSNEFIKSILLWRIWMRLGVQDVRLRFRRSAIGFWWIFVNLAAMILTVGFVYSNLLGQDLRDFIPFLTVGIIVWSYITNSIVEGGGAFINSEGYIKQISLPIYVYTFRYFVSISLSTALSFIVFGVVIVIYSIPVQPGILWVVPGILLLMTISCSLIIIFAFLNTRYRDVAHLATVGMQVLFYFTPVLFPAELLYKRGVGIVIDVNPLYHLLETIRRPLLDSEPATTVNYLVAVGFMLLLVLGIVLVNWRYRRRIVYYL